MGRCWSLLPLECATRVCGEARVPLRTFTSTAEYPLVTFCSRRVSALGVWALAARGVP